MKKLLMIILILITIQGYTQTENSISLDLNGGYSFNRSLPVAGMELGANINNIYIGLQGMICASRQVGVPAIISLNTGYNIGQFKPFISCGYQTAGNEYKSTFNPDFKLGGGISYYFVEVPILITTQIQGEEIILNTGVNIIF